MCAMMRRRQGSCAVAFAVLAISMQLILAADADDVLFCVHNEDERSECRRLRTMLDNDCAAHTGAAENCLRFSCVIAADCRVEIRDDRADVMMASALGLWYLHRDFKDVYAPVVAENRGRVALQGREDGLTYKAVAIATQDKCNSPEVVQGGGLTLAKSKGLMSCHGEYGDLAGWVAPIAKMKKLGLSSGGTDIDMVTYWFDASCAPSNLDDGLCSACYDDEYCDLDDPYANPLGVIECLRADAADIGFVDHWTAWGAGQEENDDGGDADLTAMSDLRVVCDSGCRDLSAAVEADCYLTEVPADVAIMRATDPNLEVVRARLAEASNSTQFKETFGTSSNLNGALFSHGTNRLTPVFMASQDYLKDLDGTLTQFSGLFEDSVDLPQPDVSDNQLISEVQAHPGWAVAITFMCAMLLGIVGGLALTTFICRRRMRAVRRHIQSLDKGMDMGAPAVLNPSGRHNRVADHDTWIDES